MAKIPSVNLHLIKTGLQEYGQKEIPGQEHNKRIMEYAKDCQMAYPGDETAWCSLFVNWLMFKVECEKTNKLTARSWLEVGIHVDIPVLGDIVILWRDNPHSWKGHVGLFITQYHGKIYILGGNQANMVNITGYKEIQLLEFRSPKALNPTKISDLINCYKRKIGSFYYRGKKRYRT